MNITSLFSRDTAENSIMQTITIAVSAILIAAGLVTAPGLINNARDNNAKTDLANVAFAQEFYLADTGHYAADLAEIRVLYSGNATHVAGTESGPALTLSGGVEFAMTVASDGSSYLLAAKSESGRTFYRSSGTAKTVDDLADLDTHGLAVPTFGADDNNTPVPDVAAEITTSSLPAGERTVAYSASVSATGTGSITFSATGLPAGLNISDEGVISGTPAASGTSSVVVTATNSAGSDSKTLTLVVAPHTVALSGLLCTNTGSGNARRVTFSWTSASDGGYTVQAQRDGNWLAIAAPTASVASSAAITGTLPAPTILTWAAGTYPVRILDSEGQTVATSSLRVATNTIPAYNYLVCV